MLRLGILSPSIRKGRNSHRAALYIKSFIEERNIGVADMIDLLEYRFPIFDERLKYQEHPDPGMTDFADRIKSSDGIIMIVPEYNGGYPASLKNAVDLLTFEWRRKPVAFITVSDGNFAGTQVIISLQFVLWKMGAITVTGPMRIGNIDTVIDAKGMPADKESLDKRASSFIETLVWYIEANNR